jgi:hypothetical protein
LKGIIPFIKSAAVKFFPSWFLTETEQENLKRNDLGLLLQAGGYFLNIRSVTYIVILSYRVQSHKH